jgi:HlyD family secretion protein
LEAKSDLLKSLQIDRGGEGAGGTGRGSLLVAGAAVAIALAVGLGAGWMLRGAKPAPKAAPVAATAPASKSAALPAGSLSASGYVVARRQATVAAETTGRLLEVRIEEGQAVRAGEVLAVLEPTLAEAQLQSAQARTAAAEADLAEAQRVLARAQQLHKTGFATEATLTAARSRHDQALAQRNAARSEARRSGAELARYEIRAPFDGVVVNMSAQPGEIISPISAGGGFTRTGVCTIVDMSSLEIEVDVSEAYIARVRQGQKVAAVLDAYPDTTFDAFVIATIPSADRSKATVRVRIGFEKLDPRILPEMAISVRFLDDQA